MNEMSGKKSGKYLFFNRDQKTIIYDLSISKFVRRLKSGEERALSEASVSAFFRGLTFKDIAESFRDRKYVKLMGLALAECKKKRKRLSNIGSILAHLNEVSHCESYILLEIENATAFTRPVSQFSKPVIEFMRTSRIEFDRMWEVRYKDNPELISNLCQLVIREYLNDMEVYRSLVSLVCDWQFRTFKNLIENGHDYRHLFKYLIRINTTEAIDTTSAVSLYSDYKTMVSEMGVNHFVKYTSSLKLRHDIAARNHRAMKKSYDDVKFAKQVEPRLQHVTNRYAAIVPKKPEDIRYEGVQLSHCVAGYINKVIDGTTQIVFLRNRDLPDVPLVTMEVRNRAIVQARRIENLDPYPEQVEWIKDYAKTKNLTYGDVSVNPDLPSPCFIVPMKKRIGKPFMQVQF